MAQHYRPTPGTAGFLEMEQDPSHHNLQQRQEQQQDGDLLGLGPAPSPWSVEEEPIRTTSGLLLTHRRNDGRHASGPAHSTRTTAVPSFDRIPSSASRAHAATFSTPALELSGLDDDENPPSSSYPYSASAYPSTNSFWFWNDSPYSIPAKSSLLMVRTKRLVQFWTVLLSIFFLLGTMTILRVMRHETTTARTHNGTINSSTATTETSTTITPQESSSNNDNVVEQIFLIPFPNTDPSGATIAAAAAKDAENGDGRRHLTTSPQFHVAVPPSNHHEHSIQHVLRQEFHEWMTRHEKRYASLEELDRRFQIWTDNHHRTIAKNERHGPCPMTGQPVFGSNHFQDLAPNEFQSQFLTGYKGPRHDELLNTVRDNRQTTRHHLLTMDQLMMQKGVSSSIPQRMTTEQTLPWRMRSSSHVAPHYMSSSGCSWTDVSCWLRWMARKFLYGIGGTLVPNGSYPDALDWRDMNGVTQIHSQGNCGACWAITAVETVESAYAISTGTMVDLQESEVILCDDTCEMCEGGWPQNAYDYVMENDGLPLEDNWSYDGDILLELSMIRTGESDYDESYLEGYQQSYCPNGSGSHSGDNNNDGSGVYTNVARYGSISGYGYATDRCVCYSDGTGCDCDEQNEKLALQNLASYGPATVCLEASTWQDYAGGIMSSEIGCSSAFLDMNHCIQAVGYAFVDLDAAEDEDGENGKQGSGSGSGSQGSRDDGNRQGYWIVRNQWSSNWGINGYAYVAMGENTCGILNDMTQAYM